MKTKIGTYPLRLPLSLRKAVEEASRADGTSINQFAVTAIAEKLSALKTAEYFEERASRADIEAARLILRRNGGVEPEPEDRLE